MFARGHYSSEAGVPQRMLAPAEPEEVPADQAIEPGGIVDLTARMATDDRLDWEVPAGSWTVMRFGHTSTGANTSTKPGRLVWLIWTRSGGVPPAIMVVTFSS